MGSDPDKLGLDFNATSNHESLRFLDSVDSSASSPVREDPDSTDGAILPRDQQQKTATYDYAYEKSMSHAEAKLFYQHHQLSTKSGDNTLPSSPATVARSATDHEERAMNADLSPHIQNQTARKTSMTMEPEWNLGPSSYHGADGIHHVQDSHGHLADHTARGPCYLLGSCSSCSSEPGTVHVGK